MDIALKFKRAVAVLSAGVIFASTFVLGMGHASAAYTDVPVGVWYGEAVDELLAQGILDNTKTTFNGADSANRAEVTAMLVRAIDGMVGYQAPAVATYQDNNVASAWFYDVIEAATQLGILNGDTDPETQLPTGFVRPASFVNRAEVAKMISLAFELETILEPANDFSDVPASAWFSNYVTIGVNNGVIAGYPDGTYKPANDVNRAELAVLIHRAMNPDPIDPPGEVDCVAEPEHPECQDIGESTGDLEVSLSPNTPTGTTLPLSANGVYLATYDFTATGDDVTLLNLIVTRNDVGQPEDFDQVYLYEGKNRLTSGRTISNDHEVKFPLKLEIMSGETLSLSLVGDVAGAGTAGTNNNHYFSIMSVDDLVHNGSGTSGDFAINGETFEIGGQNTVVNTVTVESGPAPSKVQLGEMSAELATLRIEAGSGSSLAIESLALNNAGTFDASDLENLVLKVGDEVVATSEGLMNDIVTFVFDEAYVLQDGQTKTFYVEGDLTGGKADETFLFYLEEDADIQAIDLDYGFGADVDNQFALAQANTVTVEGGPVNVVDNGPAASQVANDSKGVALLNVGLTPDRDLTVRNTQVSVQVQNPDGTNPSFTANNASTLNGVAPVLGANGCSASEYSVDLANDANFSVADMFQVGNFFARVTDQGNGVDFCAASSDDLTTVADVNAAVTEVNPYAYLEDLELFNLDTESTEAGPLSTVSAGTLCTGDNLPAAFVVCEKANVYAYDFNQDYFLTEGETLNLSVRVDISQEMVPGYQVSALIQFAANSIKDEIANQFIPTSDIIGAGDTALSGDFMIVAQDDLTVAVASNPSSQTYVKGGKVPALGISLSAGDAGDVEVDRIPVRIYANTADNVWGDAEGDTAANTVMSTMTLYLDGEMIGQTENIKLVDAGNNGYTAGTDYFEATFEDLNLMIPAGNTKNIEAHVQLLNTLNATRYLALDVNPGDITAEDSDADTVVPSGAQINGGITKNPLITVIGSGVLSASSEGNPDADILLAGSQEVLVSKYRFNAVDEDFLVKKLTITNDTDGGDFDTPGLSQAVDDVIIKYTDENNVQKTSVQPLVNPGDAKFSGLDFFVPAGEERFLEVYVNVSTMGAVGEELSGQLLRLGLKNDGNDITTFEAIGQSSSLNENFDDGDEVSNSVDVDEFVIRQTVPTVSNAVANTGLSNGTRDLIAFKVASDSAGSTGLARMVFDLNVDDADDLNLVLNNFKLERNGVPLDDADVNIWNAGVASITETDGGTIANDASVKIVVSLDEEITIGAGDEDEFRLTANVVGSGTDDSIDTGLATGDETVAVTGILTVGCAVNPASTGNGNTGRIHDTNANCGLLTVAGNEFSQTATAARNFLWSDKSADVHNYPAVAAGSVTDGNGSYDFTNGHLLDLNDLDSHTLTK